MRTTEIRIDFSRTLVPPGGDRFQPIKVGAGISVQIGPDDDPAKVRADAQIELGALLEETYRAQHRAKAPEQPARAPEEPQRRAFAPAMPEEELEY
jgi:hypothetical protein